MKMGDTYRIVELPFYEKDAGIGYHKGVRMTHVVKWLDVENQRFENVRVLDDIDSILACLDTGEWWIIASAEEDDHKFEDQGPFTLDEAMVIFKLSTVAR